MENPTMQQAQSIIKPLIERQVAQDFNRAMQEMDKQLNEFDLLLNGQRLVKDQEGNTTVVQETTPRMNTIGRQEVMGRLRMFLNHNTWMMQIEPQATETNYMVEAAAIHRMLAENHQKYELTLPNARFIADVVCQVMIFALYKAETDKQTIYDTMHSNNVQPGQQQPQGILAGMANGLFKR